MSTLNICGNDFEDCGKCDQDKNCPLYNPDFENNDNEFIEKNLSAAFLTYSDDPDHL